MSHAAHLSAAVALSTVFAFPALAQTTGAEGATPADVVVVAPTYAAGAATPSFGTVTQIAKTVAAQAFRPRDSGVTYMTANTGGTYIFQTSTTQVDWWAGVDLPAGAIVDNVELQACDTTATGEIMFGMTAMDTPGQSGGNVTPTGSTGGSATPGCATFAVTPFAPVQIDNHNKRYMLYVAWVGDFTIANKLAAVRVHYRLQVSPAPPVQTFNDVPTSHFFHRWIEALAASGITAGCGGGNFCPDATVTRAQMAVFLSVALGLHFPF